MIESHVAYNHALKDVVLRADQITLKEETVMHVMSVGRVVHTVFVFTQKDDLYSSNCIETSIEELMSMPVDMYDVRIMFTDHTWSKLEKENNRYSWKHNSQV